MRNNLTIVYCKHEPQIADLRISAPMDPQPRWGASAMFLQATISMMVHEVLEVTLLFAWIHEFPRLSVRHVCTSADVPSSLPQATVYRQASFLQFRGFVDDRCPATEACGFEDDRCPATKSSDMALTESLQVAASPCSPPL